VGGCIWGGYVGFVQIVCRVCTYVSLLISRPWPLLLKSQSCLLVEPRQHELEWPRLDIKI